MGNEKKSLTNLFSSFVFGDDARHAAKAIKNTIHQQFVNQFVFSFTQLSRFSMEIKYKKEKKFYRSQLLNRFDFIEDFNQKLFKVFGCQMWNF